MKTRIFLIVIFMGAFLLSGCWNSRELTDMAIVVGMGVDKAEKEGTYRVSFQIVNPGSISMGKQGGSTGQSMPVTVYSGVDHTLFGALRKSTQKVPRQLFFSHIQTIVLSEEAARDGIQEVFDIFDRSHELRLNTPVVIARGMDAETALSIITPLENMPSVGIAKRMKVSSGLFAQNLDVNISDVIRGLSGGAGFAISGVEVVGDLKSGQSRKNTQLTKLPASIEMKGIALFKDGKLRMWADGKAARGILWAKNEMKGTAMDISCGKMPEGISIELTNSRTTVDVSMRNGRPAFSVRVSEEGSLVEVHCPFDLAKPEAIVKLQNEWAKETEKEIEKAIELAQKEKIDIFGFGEALNRKYPKVWKDMENNWPEAFANSVVEVRTEAYLRRTGMTLKPRME